MGKSSIVEIANAAKALGDSFAPPIGAIVEAAYARYKVISQPYTYRGEWVVTVDVIPLKNTGASCTLLYVTDPYTLLTLTEKTLPFEQWQRVPTL